jgi:hypothetical protein
MWLPPASHVAPPIASVRCPSPLPASASQVPGRSRPGAACGRQAVSLGRRPGAPSAEGRMSVDEIRSRTRRHHRRRFSPRRRNGRRPRRLSCRPGRDRYRRVPRRARHTGPVPDGLPDDELALPASRYCDSFKPSTAVEVAGSQTNFGHCSIGPPASWASSCDSPPEPSHLACQPSSPCSNPMTPPQLDPSADAPWTRTMFRRGFTLGALF